MIDTKYFAVIDADGVIVHTTVSLTPENAIEEWLKIEQSMAWLGNVVAAAKGRPQRCCKSWEGYEAEGLTIKEIKLEII